MAELRTLRTKRAIHEGAVVAEILDDEVHVVKGRGADQRFHEIEIETLNGDLQTVAMLRSLLQQAGAGRVERLAKNQRIARGSADPEIPLRPVKKNSTGVDIFAAAFAAAAEQLVRSGAALRAERNAEVLHEMRTAVRRLRSYLRSFRPLLERRWTERLRDKLGWVNRLLAKARNLDVLILLLQTEARKLETKPFATAYVNRVLPDCSTT